MNNKLLLVKIIAYENVPGGDVMVRNRRKEGFMELPIEKHTTASWANNSTQKRISRVNLPDEAEVINAKEWVDSNEK